MHPGLRFLVLSAVLASASLQAQPLTNCTASALVSALAVDGAVVTLTNCSISLSNVISITGSATIIGQGTNSTIGANNLTRIFEILPGARLEVSGVTLTGGRHQRGAAVYVHEHGQAVFSNCVFSANSVLGRSGLAGLDGAASWSAGEDGQAGEDGDRALGGAIFNLGEVTLLHCQFISNNARGGDGGQGGDGGAGGWRGGDGGRGGNAATGRGGAVYNSGTLVVRDTTMAGNLAQGGNGALGGIGGDGPAPGIAGRGGYGARGVGAAIFNDGVAMIANSSFVTNTATGGNSAHDGSITGGLEGGDGHNGGGGFGGGVCNMNSMAVTNCTFSGNRAVGGAGANGGNGRYAAGDGGDGGEGYGGGIYNTGVYWLINCTIAQNSVAGGTNGLAGSGPSPGRDGVRGPTMGAGFSTTGSSELNIRNSILHANTGAGNGSGPVVDLGNNLSSDGSIAFGPESFKNKNARLGPLANNGGPTRTMLPQPGSPALLAGTLEGTLPFDQRGFPRPGPGKPQPDIGAVEVQPPAITNEPVSQVVALGGTATFSVGVTGDAPLTFAWLRSGTNIPGASGATLTISNVTAAVTGLNVPYVVTISNAVGRVQSAPAYLSIGALPVITNHPVSQTVSPGADVSFTVGATGAPPLSVQWLSNSVPLALSTNWTLLLTNVQPSFAGDYSARVANPSGSVTSNPARLTILSAPILDPGLPPGGTNFALTFPTQTGVTYITEFKDTLSALVWTPLTTNGGTGLSVTNMDLTTNLPSRFYRIRAY
jgi:hypothetical protein